MSLVEIEFKGKRKGIFKNPQEFPLKRDDRVIVKADRGEDIGKVTLIGAEWDEFINEANEGAEENEAIVRLAGKEDETREKENRRLEKEARGFFVDEVKKLGLEMKLVDIEYQFDRRKLTFYFTADGRVDFRELVKVLANNFHTRIDLRQIGARDESKRLGGLGLCGRELCCASWIREFKPVTTLMLKEQNLLLNPQKNTGLCGKLRCCLRYEVDQYRDVNLRFPKPEQTKVKGPRGDGIIEKVNFCHSSIGIIWSDGYRASYSEQDIKELTNWDIEKREEFKLLEFKKDPTIVQEEEQEKNGSLVASYEPPTAKFGVKDTEKKPTDQKPSSSPGLPPPGGKPPRGPRGGKPGGNRKMTHKSSRGPRKQGSSTDKKEIVVLRPVEKPVRSEDSGKPKKSGTVKKGRRPNYRNGKSQQNSNSNQNTNRDKESSKPSGQDKQSNSNSNTTQRPPSNSGRRRKR